MSYVKGWLGEMLEWVAEDEPTAERAAGLIMKAQVEAEDRTYRSIEKWFRDEGIDSAADVVKCLRAASLLPRLRVAMLDDEKRNARIDRERAAHQATGETRGGVRE